MNRTTQWILVIVVFITTAVALGCIIYLDNNIEGNKTSTTSSVPQLGIAQACITITGMELERLRVAGVPLSYENDVWYFYDTPVGVASFEDESFAACGETLFMNDIIDIALGE